MPLQEQTFLDGSSVFALDDNPELAPIIFWKYDHSQTGEWKLIKQDNLVDFSGNGINFQLMNAKGEKD